jgi:aryl-alcohol dehydrogenase-like predicted oxidoreductase
VETRRIGTLDVSFAGLGCNNFGMRIDEEGSQAVVDAAFDAGITLFDTSDIYGNTQSEVFLGQALGTRRNEVVITTKFGALAPPAGILHGSAQWVAQACADSLRRLGTDFIDLYLMHFPDPQVPIEETLGALNELVVAGKVREIGCSNFTAPMIDDATATAASRGTHAFSNLQTNYSLLDRTPELELVPACARADMTVVPYFPLASGMLTGKYRRGESPREGTRMSAMADRYADLLTDECFDVIEALDKYARDHGHTLHELALSWLASKPLVPSVIAGATTPDQVRANAAATVAWALTDAERAEVDSITRADYSFVIPKALRESGGLAPR